MPIHTAYIDGGARGNPGPAAAGVQIRDAAGRVIFAGGLFLGHKTNNEAEYAGLLLALELLHAARVGEIRIRSDSELLVRQMQGRYKVKASNLKPLYGRAAAAIRRFEKADVGHVPREQNKDADALANQAMDAAADVVPVDTLNLLSRIERPAVTATPASLFDAPRGASPASSLRTPDPVPQPVRARNETASPRSGSIVATVIKAPRQAVCAARVRAGQVFQFGDTVPVGLCLHACSAMIDAVLALQAIVADPDAGPLEPMTATCQHADCGAVFQIRSSG